ncbi:5'-methylthioadenosine/S-adenosylhomocysteine nucleosidase [Streptomyces sp. NPDC096205]|uniref:5'-methylthioadenosine/S-adenosylhomocysteine nucleosidase n=1 Tax=Streptomyces sp. NPDC096205 TaxID=3366081 RepID=UPI0038006F66
MPPRDHTVVVLTALALEYAAVRPYVPEREERVHRDGTRVEVGRLPGTDWQVALAELGEGTRTAASLTTRIIDWLEPEAVLFVGVAGSLKRDIGLGDVVIGTKVYGIHGGKLTPTGFEVRPEAWPVSNALLSAARSAVRDMDGVRAHFKPIASGDVVLADAESDIARHLREHYNDAAAIEMEGVGAVQAAHLNGQLHALVVRGISDHADAAKSAADGRGSQESAAAQAASVAVAVLRRHRPQGSSVPEEGPHPGSTYGGDHIDFRGATFHGPVTGKRQH